MVTNGSGSGLKFFKTILFRHGSTALQTTNIAELVAGKSDCRCLDRQLSRLSALPQRSQLKRETASVISQ